MTGSTEPSNNITTGEDPTKAILSESSLEKKFLCDYVINVATGCRHGCKFCYVPSTPNIRARPDMLAEEAGVENSQKEWGTYVLYRDGLAERLDDHLERKRKWKTTEKGCGIVGISFSTDCYMDGRAGRITRDVVEVLADHERYARVLTRNPILALQDKHVFEDAGEYVTIGTSIPSLRTEEVDAIEPRAPAPEHRLRGLKEFSEEGVRTFVSVSPTYPTMGRDSIRELLETVSECDPDVVFHEPINPRAGNFDMCVRAARDEGECELAEELERLRDTDHWVEYAVRQFRDVQEIGAELGLPVHLWPDTELVKRAQSGVSEWLLEWRERQSPEDFARRESPQGDPPPIPDAV